MSSDTNANEQRQLINEMVETLDVVEGDEASDAQVEKAQRLRDVLLGLDETAKEGADVTASLKPLVSEMKALTEEITEGEGRENSVCNCNHGGSGTCRCSTSTEGGDGQPSANYSGVPGTVNRDVGRDSMRENANDYPPGGRKAWEREQMGIEQSDDEMPAGGRVAWERRQAGVEQTPSSEYSGGRESWQRRQNASDAVDASQWKGHDYPLLAKRKAEERAEKRERWNSLRESARCQPLNQ